MLSYDCNRIKIFKDLHLIKGSDMKKALLILLVIIAAIFLGMWIQFTFHQSNEYTITAKSVTAEKK